MRELHEWNTQKRKGRLEENQEGVVKLPLLATQRRIATQLISRSKGNRNKR